MYWKLFLEKVERSFTRRRRRSLMRAGIVAALLMVGVGLLLADYFKGRGEYSRLKSRLEGPETAEAPFRPGGQDPILLTRTPLSDTVPEFVSATLLPGLGLDVLQITASFPGKGEVRLLASDYPAEPAVPMSEQGLNEAGSANLTQDGGTFLVPWAGRLGGVIGADGKTASVVWRRRTFHLPANAAESAAPAAYGGLLGKSAASTVQVNPMPDGESANATFGSGSWNGQWPSQTETNILVLLAGRTLELMVRVRNTGEEATPVGVGWAPRFLIPGGDRAKVKLHVPASLREVMSQNGTGVPTGELDAVKGTAYDFNAPGGVALGMRGLNDTFVHWKTMPGEHPAIELRDAAARFGVRISALTPNIKAVRVNSPANAGFVTISPQMNYDDPFGRQWADGVDTGMVVLQPGQTVEWRVRVELIAP